MSSSLPLLVVRHVPWEGPHRILDAFDGVPVLVHDSFSPGARLPLVAAVRGAVFMGGPMSVNDVHRLPWLADEVRWLRDALDAELPVLGICLGSQLLAVARGGRVAPGPALELGFAPVEVLDGEDPLLGALAPATTVLHWHGELIELPVGTTALARSQPTAVQAFRAGRSAWGLLFHPEADAALLDLWLAEPSMADEAREQLGDDYERILREAVKGVDLARGRSLFDAFAERCAAVAAGA